MDQTCTNSSKLWTINFVKNMSLISFCDANDVKYICWGFFPTSYWLFDLISVLHKKPELHHYRLHLREVKLTWNAPKSNDKVSEISHCVSFNVFQPRVGMCANTFAFSKMKTVVCSHNDKDWLPLKSASVCFLHQVFLAGSESCNGNIRIIFGCHCLQYYWF